MIAGFLLSSYQCKVEGRASTGLQIFGHEVFPFVTHYCPYFGVARKEHMFLDAFSVHNLCNFVVDFVLGLAIQLFVCRTECFICFNVVNRTG